MSRRIVGQCNTADFKHLEHLVDWVDQGKEIDVSSLTKSQQNAIRVLAYFQKCDVPFGILLQLREVLIWQYDEGGYAFEYRLLHPGDRETVLILRTMRSMREHE